MESGETKTTMFPGMFVKPVWRIGKRANAYIGPPAANTVMAQ